MNAQNLELFPEFQDSVSPEVKQAIDALAAAEGAEGRGAIFTRAEVVDFILDLIGYTQDKPLHELRILEPSFGGGEFLRAIVRRLLESWKIQESNSPLKDLGQSIRAVELHRETFDATRKILLQDLRLFGLTEKSAIELCNVWLRQGDFLLSPMEGKFNFVAGNPPYVRPERIPNTLLKVYRQKFETMYDRSDLYIPFIERSLSLLADKGALGFICADRWTKNKYGGPLRNLVSEGFHLRIYVDMVNTSAFHSDVIAYPAITVIGREKSGPTRVAHSPSLEPKELSTLAKNLVSVRASKLKNSIREMASVVNGAEPWLLESPDQMELIRRLERDFPTIEQVGCKVGIGVATGADKAFIHDFETLKVEPDRKLPLATTRDIQSGEVQWKGLGVVNPFADGGGLVNLADYPLLRDYLESRKEAIAKRHCARKAPANWYRTIDRIHPALASKPKLLIPDIKGKAHVVYEDGQLYPHHNLYFITSETWDLRALQAVLLSSVARLFVATYSTKMRGGFLRFQAQYLRRIHIPEWKNVPKGLRSKLISAAKSRDAHACDHATFQLFNLSNEERALLGGNGK